MYGTCPVWRRGRLLERSPGIEEEVRPDLVPAADLALLRRPGVRSVFLAGFVTHDARKHAPAQRAGIAPSAGLSARSDVIGCSV